MAHFAEINQNNLVLRILVVPDEQEHRGQEFLADDLVLGGTWIQCSYNHKIRKQYPGSGYIYDVNHDVFIAPKPYDSWILDINYDWQSPIPYPDDGNMYVWDEETLNWRLIHDENKLGLVR
jgi:hypothetical protein